MTVAMRLVAGGLSERGESRKGRGEKRKLIGSDCVQVSSCIGNREAIIPQYFHLHLYVGHVDDNEGGPDGGLG